MNFDDFSMPKEEAKMTFNDFSAPSKDPMAFDDFKPPPADNFNFDNFDAVPNTQTFNNTLNENPPVLDFNFEDPDKKDEADVDEGFEFGQGSDTGRFEEDR